MKILHIISGLSAGGAERTLFQLCVNDNANSHAVISLTSEGIYGPLLASQGVPVSCLHIKTLRSLILGALAIRSVIKSQKPDLVQTWMYHADAIGGLTSWLSGNNRIVWNIRQSNISLSGNKFKTYMLIRFLAILSYVLPKRIIVCASRAAKSHQKIGYCISKFKLVTNGVDSSLFKPSETGLAKFWTEAYPKKQCLRLGCVARFDKQKGHANLFKALQLLIAQGLEFECVLVGDGIDRNNTALLSLAASYGCESHLVLLGYRADIPNIMNEIDIYVLPSNGEGFPNVVVEAMASGTPA